MADKSRKTDFGWIGKFWWNLWAFYKKKIYPHAKIVRGTTRVNSFFKSRALDSFEGEPPFNVRYRDNTFRFYDATDFTPLLLSKVVEGYTRFRDISSSDTVIDAGAYPGEFSLYAAKQGASVYSLEPSKTHRALLEENIAANDYPGSVEILNLGLSDRDTTANFQGEKIQLTTLDRIVKENKIASLDFVKMDIEGEEIDAVKGAEKTIEKFSPFFAIASYHTVNGEKTCYNLEDFFESKGWEATTDYPRHLTTYAWKTTPRIM